MTSTTRALDDRPPASGPGRLPNRALFAYGFLNLPLSIAGLPLVLYIAPFYASDVGLALTAIGLVLMLGRISDAFTDPLIGVLSDRWRSRWGRRKPWILIGTPLMMLATWMVFVPPAGVGWVYLLVWISVLYLGWTMVQIPYAAWGAELSPDYHERSRIAGSREVFQIIGLLIASSLPLIVAASVGQAPPAPGEAASLRPVMEVLAIAATVLLPLAAVLAVLFVPDRPAPLAPARRVPFKRALRVVVRNGPFMRLLIATLIGGVAASMNFNLAILFYTHAMQLPEAAGGLLFLYFVIGVMALPLWIWLAKRVNKHRALCYASLWGVGWFATYPFLPPGDMTLMTVVTIATGMSMAAGPVLGASIAADVVDLDTARGGAQRSAMFFAFWGMGSKFALAAGVGIALPALELLGFSAIGPNEPDAIFALVTFYCLVPIALWLVTISILWNFPIDQKRQKRLQDRIARRAAIAGNPLAENVH